MFGLLMFNDTKSCSIGRLFCQMNVNSAAMHTHREILIPFTHSHKLLYLTNLPPMLL